MFNVTPDDLRRKLNPTNEPTGFLGEESELDPVTDVQPVIDEWDETVQGRLPGRVFSLLTRVDGEVLCQCAAGDGTETEFQLSLFPCSSVELYRNYMKPLWSERKPCDRLGADEFEVDEETGVVTLSTPLNAGENLIACYDHQAASKCLVLRRIVIDLAAAEWARRLWPGEAQEETAKAWELQAYSDLSRIQKMAKDGKLGIPMIDRMHLVDETRIDRMVIDMGDMGGGMM